MSISCIICSDTFNGTSSVVSVPCGHVFHESCIAQWISQSTTCPQCRNPVRDTSFTKLYFNVGENEGSVESMGNKILSLVDIIGQQDAITNRLLLDLNDMKNLDVKRQSAESKLLTLLKDQTYLVQELKAKSAKLKELEKANLYLSGKLKSLKDSNLLVLGTHEEVNKLFHNESSKYMAHKCSDLKCRYQRMREAEQKLQCELENLRQKYQKSPLEIMKFLLKVKERKMQCLKIRISKLEQEISKPNESSSSKTVEHSCTWPSSSGSTAVMQEQTSVPPSKRQKLNSITETSVGQDDIEICFDSRRENRET